jgi:hypothetical protein
MEFHSSFFKSVAYVENAASSGPVRGVFAIEAAREVTLG